MKKYEVMYIISPKLEDKKRDELITKFEQIIVENKGEVDSTEKIGSKKLAYPIKHNTNGFYVLTRFTASSIVPKELERQMRLTDHVLRFIVVADYDKLELLQKKKAKKRKETRAKKAFEQPKTDINETQSYDNDNVSINSGAGNE